MIRCSGVITNSCLGTTDEVYRLTSAYDGQRRKPFGLCIECLSAAIRLGLPVERVHGYAARAIANDLPAGGTARMAA